ncbi:MAG: hypothetical protein ACLFU7_03820 [Armatimonadota bacterium]
MTAAAWIATVIFVAVYALLILDKLPKATVVLAGASVMIVLGVLGQHTAFHGTETVQGVGWDFIYVNFPITFVIFILLCLPTNLVAAAIAARSGHPVSFKRFIVRGVPITFSFIALCAIYCGFGSSQADRHLWTTSKNLGRGSGMTPHPAECHSITLC